MDKYRDKLDVVLAEYKALRDELIDKTRLQVQIYALYITALVIFYSSIFTHKIYDVVVILPILSCALLFRVIWEQLIITDLSHYIYEIEDQKIPLLIGKINNSRTSQEGEYSNLWLGWQHSYWKKKPHPYYEYSVIMLFLVISILPPLAYTIYSIIAPLLGMPVVTKLPFMEIHGFLLILNSLLGCYSYTIIRRHIMWRRMDWKK